MALIIYPTTDWDSYISLADADTSIAANVLDTTLWDALTDAHKEFYLKQSTLLIKLRITDPSVEETPDDLELATVLLANYSIGKDMTNQDGSQNLKIKDLTGVIKKEWFSPGRSSNSFPDLVSSLLSQYGFTTYGTLVLDRS